MPIILKSSDHAAIGEVVESAHEMIKHSSLAYLPPVGLRTPEVLCRVGACRPLSDAATRAAQGLGIVASRERHYGHFFTSFNPLDQPLSEEDLILCMTWGQYPITGLAEPKQEYFGRRAGLKDLIDNLSYDYNFSVSTVEFREVAHTPSTITDTDFPARHLWLKTTPEEVLSGEYPTGEIPRDDYPDDRWEQSHIAKATKLIVISPKTPIHYFGMMEMVLTVSPAFNEIDETHIRFVDESESPYQ